MTSAWRETWSRLARMSWDELHTRVAQEVSKRLDVARCRAGLPPGKNGLNIQPPTVGSFFFSLGDLPRLADVLRERLGPEVEILLHEADEICRHRFRLLGYTNLDYGPEIDWHLDAVHAKRAPLKPWFKIDFLDFTEVGDHKVTWELNRHQHLVTLAKAWCLSHREQYVTELTRQWYSWQRANPYPLGINWGSSLEVAFRSLSWLWVLHLLAGCPVLPADFETDVLHGLALNGRHIERYLSTYFSPNTHLLGEAVALFFIGTLCPQLPAAERWRNRGWRMVLGGAERQVRPDGVYFEQSLYYHIYALDFFLHARMLAARNQLEIPASFDVTLGKMLEVVQAVSQAGPADGFGDDDGGRVFNARRNRAEHMTDPLAIGAIIFRRDDLRATATLTEEAVWLCGQQAASYLQERTYVRPKVEPKSFEAGGIYVMAGSESCAQQMVIDAGPQGTGRSGHGHADALSVRVSLDGQRWLIDPGTFCYISAGNERNLFRGTGAHNTLRVDGLDQAVPEGPFAWSSIPKVRAERWLPGVTFTLFVGSHTGYCRLPDPVVHRRHVFHLPGSFWLVHDVAEGSELHLLESSWHFAPHLTVVNAGDSFIALTSQDREPTQAGEFTRLALLPVQQSGWSCELESGDVAPAYGCREAAPVIRCSARVRLPAEHAILLRPLPPGYGKLGNFIQIVGEATRNDGPAVAYRYDEDQQTHYMIFAGAEEKTWTLGPWTSDAKFLYCRVEDRGVTHLVFCGGSFAQVHGEAAITLRQVIERFEWVSRGGVRQTYSSDETAVQSLSEGAVESCNSVF